MAIALATSMLAGTTTIFNLGWQHDGLNLEGFRLYRVDAYGVKTQVGDDISLTLRMTSETMATGVYSLEMVAFSGIFESLPSNLLVVRVSRKGARELK